MGNGIWIKEKKIINEMLVLKRLKFISVTKTKFHQKKFNF